MAGQFLAVRRAVLQVVWRSAVCDIGSHLEVSDVDDAVAQPCGTCCLGGAVMLHEVTEAGDAFAAGSAHRASADGGAELPSGRAAAEARPGPNQTYAPEHERDRNETPAGRYRRWYEERIAVAPRYDRIGTACRDGHPPERGPRTHHHVR